MSALSETMDHASLQNKITHTGKYLTFFLDKEENGIEITRIREIFGMMTVTRIPHRCLRKRSHQPAG